MTIRVTDESGAVIAKAFVLIHSDAPEQRTLKPFTLEPENSKPFSMELRTGSEGETKSDLSAGFYDLFIDATGFAPYCEKIIPISQVEYVQFGLWHGFDIHSAGWNEETGVAIQAQPPEFERF